VSDEIVLPSLVVKTDKSVFRLRCHAAAWSDEYGGSFKVMRRHAADLPGLLMLSATGPDTAVKAVRATLYEPEIQAEIDLLGDDETSAKLLKARITQDGKPASYTAAVAKLAPGVVHLVALAKLPGLMPNMSDDHLWAELSGPRYTTPLLRSWTRWLKENMTDSGGIIAAEGYAAKVGVLKMEPDSLDEVVSQGVREHQLTLCG
jgi:hypothetical protein